MCLYIAVIFSCNLCSDFIYFQILYYLHIKHLFLFFHNMSNCSSKFLALSFIILKINLFYYNDLSMYTQWEIKLSKAKTRKIILHLDIHSKQFSSLLKCKQICDIDNVPLNTSQIFVPIILCQLKCRYNKNYLSLQSSICISNVHMLSIPDKTIKSVYFSSFLFNCLLFCL